MPLSQMFEEKINKHWARYQNPEPFVWFVLIDQVPLKSKQTEQKVPDFGIPPSVNDQEHSRILGDQILRKDPSFVTLNVV